jgi:hypothetical protein
MRTRGVLLAGTEGSNGADLVFGGSELLGLSFLPLFCQDKRQWLNFTTNVRAWSLGQCDRIQ